MVCTSAAAPNGWCLWNVGKLNVNSPSTICTITSDVHFINEGTLYVQDGVLALYESAGEYGGNLIVDAAGSVEGSAVVAFTGDTVLVNGAINLPFFIHEWCQRAATGRNRLNQWPADESVEWRYAVRQCDHFTDPGPAERDYRYRSLSCCAGSGSTVQNASQTSYVNGNVERFFQPGYLEYPVGDASFYLPVTLDLISP